MKLLRRTDYTVAPHIQAALTAYAHQNAELTHGVLQELGYGRENPQPWPAQFLIELSAVLRIGYWENRGLDAHILHGLPSFCDATQRLFKPQCCVRDQCRCQRLAPGVQTFWLTNFAWSGIELLGTDIAVDEFHEDDLAERIAQFLWMHRHALSRAEE